MEKFEPYYKERLTIFRTHRQAIMASLTPEQEVRWQEIPVRQGLERRLRAVQLTAVQQAAADKLCRDVAQQILKLPEPKDTGRVREVMDEAYKRFRFQNLTFDQRQQSEPTLDEQIQPVR